MVFKSERIGENYTLPNIMRNLSFMAIEDLILFDY